jgi:hypothetical protein
VSGVGAAKAAFDADDHHVADHVARDTGSRDCGPGDDFPITGVDGEEHPDNGPVTAMQFKVIRAPSDV